MKSTLVVLLCVSLMNMPLHGEDPCEQSASEANQTFFQKIIDSGKGMLQLIWTYVPGSGATSTPSESERSIALKKLFCDTKNALKHLLENESIKKNLNKPIHADITKKLNDFASDTAWTNFKAAWSENAATNLTESLELLRQALMALASRQDFETFNENVRHSYEGKRGVAQNILPYTLNEIYTKMLAIPATASAHEALEKTNQKISQLLEEKKRASTDKSLDDELMRFRQLTFIFANSLAKEQFDAYLTTQTTKKPDALKELSLPADGLKELLEKASYEIIFLKNGLAQIAKQEKWELVDVPVE